MTVFQWIPLFFCQRFPDGNRLAPAKCNSRRYQRRLRGEQLEDRRMLASAGGVENTLLPTFMAQRSDPNDNQLPASDAWWALRSQRNLAVEEPISDVMNIGGHNAFNSLNEGFQIFPGLSPNQILSLTGQLDLGARLVELDIHDPVDILLGLERHLILKHGPGPPLLTRPLPFDLDEALSEIQDWLFRADNRNELIFLDIEDATEQAENGADDPLIPKLQNHFGSLIYTPAERAADGAWPSRSELIERNKRVVIFTHRNDDQNGRFGAPEMYVDRINDADPTNDHVWYGASIAFRANGSDDPISDRGNFSQVKVDDLGVVPSENADYFFAMQSDGIVIPGSASKAEPADVARAVRLNVNFIKMDFLFGDDEDAGLGSNFSVPPLDPLFDISEGNRVELLEHAVWSWAKDDPAVDRQMFQDFVAGDGTGVGLYDYFEDRVGSTITQNLANIGAAARSNGRDVAIQSNGRWVSSAPVSPTPMIFAARSVTANAAGEFDWAVTTGASTNWHDGNQLIANEFGSQFVFAAPVNGFQNAQLAAGPAGQPIWMNVHDFDADGNWTSGNRAPSITVVDVLPTMVNEGSAVQLTVEFVDDPENHTLRIDWQDGSQPTELQVPAGQQQIVVSHLFADDNPLTGTPSDILNVLLTVTDSGGLADSETIDVTVQNVAPVLVGFSSDATFQNTAKEGLPVSFQAGFTDVGISDTHTAFVDWGDGSAPEALTVNQASGSGSVTGIHSFAAGGIYTVTLSLQDDDTGTDTIQTTAVVTGIGLNNGILYVIGGPRDDHVKISQKGNSRLTVRADFIADKSRSFASSAINKIISYLGDGNDHLSVSNAISIPAIIHGQGGNDHLAAGGGPSVLLGGNGNDFLIGIGSPSVLIGGLGRDLLISGRKTGDVLIGGSTNIDQNDEALMAVAMAWNSPSTYAQRVLAVDGLLDEIDDDDRDLMHGNGGLNLFYKGKNDILTGVKRTATVF